MLIDDIMSTDEIVLTETSRIDKTENRSIMVFAFFFSVVELVALSFIGLLMYFILPIQRQFLQNYSMTAFYVLVGVLGFIYACENILYLVGSFQPTAIGMIITAKTCKVVVGVFATAIACAHRSSFFLFFCELTRDQPHDCFITCDAEFSVSP